MIYTRYDSNHKYGPYVKKFEGGIALNPLFWCRCMFKEDLRDDHGPYRCIDCQGKQVLAIPMSELYDEPNH